MKTEFRNGYHINSFEADKHPGLKCIGDWLVENFGDDAAKIDGVTSWGGWTFSAARFTTCDDAGHLQVLCGGLCIITFRRDHTIDKRPAYLVVDDMHGAMVSLLRAGGQAALHQRSEPPRLRLVMCA